MAALDGSKLDIVTHGPPLTVARLATHALNNLLLWAGLAPREKIVTVENTMVALAYGGEVVSYDPMRWLGGAGDRATPAC